MGCDRSNVCGGIEQLRARKPVKPLGHLSQPDRAPKTETLCRSTLGHWNEVGLFLEDDPADETRINAQLSGGRINVAAVLGDDRAYLGASDSLAQDHRCAAITWRQARFDPWAALSSDRCAASGSINAIEIVNSHGSNELKGRSFELSGKLAQAFLRPKAAKGECTRQVRAFHFHLGSIVYITSSHLYQPSLATYTDDQDMTLTVLCVTLRDEGGLVGELCKQLLQWRKGLDMRG